jgi:hypothetical protein|tara:strand:+ start:15828 stop:16970 length:1143 start_codon:yes stop_codon:yes gene_type:complete
MAKTISNATLRLWIYQGQFGSRTADPTYTLYKERISTENSIVFEVSELIRDYTTVTFTGDFSTINQTAWAEWEITRTFSDSKTDVVRNAALCFNGYGYFEDGINPELSKGLLQSNTIIYHKKGDPFYIPVYTGEGGAFSVKYYEGASLTKTTTLGYKVKKLTVDAEWTVDDCKDCDPSGGKYTADMESINVADSQETIDTLYYDGVPSSVTITDIEGNTTTCTVYETEECKFTPYRLTFMNKFGVAQNVYFFKRRDESINITKDSYEANTITSSDATTATTDTSVKGAVVSYSLNAPTKKFFNVKGKKKLKLNTGFVDESFNEVIQQILLTEQAWIQEGGEVYPIIPVTQSLQYKTRVNDRLIDFQVEFEYAYDEINEIR